MEEQILFCKVRAVGKSAADDQIKGTDGCMISVAQFYQSSSAPLKYPNFITLITNARTHSSITNYQRTLPIEVSKKLKTKLHLEVLEVLEG